MSGKKKKSLFDRAIDALTDRDEKEAEAARAKAQADDAKREAEAREKMATQKAAAHKPTPDKAADKPAFHRAAGLEVGAKTMADRAAAQVAVEKAIANRQGVVRVRSLRIRADHNTSSEILAGLVKGEEVTVLDTWSDGKNTWAKLDRGWAAMIYDGETYIEVSP